MLPCIQSSGARACHTSPGLTILTLSPNVDWRTADSDSFVFRGNPKPPEVSSGAVAKISPPRPNPLLPGFLGTTLAAPAFTPS